MKLLYAVLTITFLCSTDSYYANASEPSGLICQFDKSTMIKDKLKKAQTCINNGNYSSAKNYLNDVLRLDPNNARVKELLRICNSGGKTQSAPRTNNSNYNNANSRNSFYNPFSVSRTDLSFDSNGGTESLTVSSGASWSISVNPNSWGHLMRSGNTLTLRVDANSATSSRTDYFKIKSGEQEIRVNITQSGSSYNTSSPYLNVSKSDLFFSSDGGQESLTISSNNTWNISVSTNPWGHLRKEGNTLTLSVDANYTGDQRTDYFVLKSGTLEKRINITQSQTYAKNGVSMYGTTRTYTDEAQGLTYLTSRIKEWEQCRLGAFTENGAGVVIYGSNGYATSGNLNSSFVEKIKEYNGNKYTFKSVAVSNSGYYCIVYGRNGWFGYVPEKMKLELNEFNNDREDIYCVSIAENGDYVIISDKHISASNSTDLSNLKKAKEKFGHIKYACVTNRALVVVCEDGIAYSKIPTNLEVKLKSITFKPDKITFTDSGTYLITNENGAYSFHM